MDDRTRAQYDEMLRQVSGYGSIMGVLSSMLGLGLQHQAHYCTCCILETPMLPVPPTLHAKALGAPLCGCDRRATMRLLLH